MRVLTLNIWNYTPPWERRRDIIAGLIQRWDPDVVGLQETRHDYRFHRGLGQGEQIGRMTGYHVTSAVAQVYVPVLPVDEGLTVLTREEPEQVAVCRLSLHPHERHDENHRICIAVLVRTPDGPVHFFNTHFSLSSEARRSNAAEVWRFVQEQAEIRPAILVGDLNAEPDSLPVRFLTGQVEIAGDRGDFMDCWRAEHPNDPGFTYSSIDPVRRIDYVLAANIGTGPTAASLVGREDGVNASDHLGIVVDVPSMRKPTV